MKELKIPIPKETRAKKKRGKAGTLEECQKSAILNVGKMVYDSASPMHKEPPKPVWQKDEKNLDVEDSAKFVKEVKNYFTSKKMVSRLELSRMTENIDRYERKLSNVSQNHKGKWKSLQSKLNFISLMRRSLRTSRKFGIEPHKSRKFFEEERRKRAIVHRKKLFVIYPDSHFNICHTLVLWVLVCLVSFFLPLNVAFDLRGWFFSALTLTTICYLVLEIVIRFFTAFFEQRVLVDDMRKIAARHLKWPLLLDLVAAFPFEYVIEFESFRVASLFKIPRLVCFIRAAFKSKGAKKAARSFLKSKIKLILSSSKIRNSLKILVSIFMFIHVVSCIWVWMLTMNDFNWYTR